MVKDAAGHGRDASMSAHNRQTSRFAMMRSSRDTGGSSCALRTEAGVREETISFTSARVAIVQMPYPFGAFGNCSDRTRNVRVLPDTILLHLSTRRKYLLHTFGKFLEKYFVPYSDL
jgi:hypothetical protein